MAKAFNGGFQRRCSSEKFEVSDRPCLDMQEFHVLAVDDSFVDRKVIERLLKISSCKGGYPNKSHCIFIFALVG